MLTTHKTIVEDNCECLLNKTGFKANFMNLHKTKFEVNFMNVYLT